MAATAGVRTPSRRARRGPSRGRRAGVPVAASMGVLGWAHLDPVLLAALALEAPLLLVGAHGTAKTHLVEQLACALDLEFRHYNAALLNYDDLVGIPLPDDHGGLRFVGTPGSIWGAKFVFFDEVNRCRPDLQNKLFPIVHERRVAGVGLPDLQHRWAAMNPPATDDPISGYLGTEVLDAALADRFWFVVQVPGWGELSRADRLALVTATPSSAGSTTGTASIESLVADVIRQLPDAELEHTDFLGRYVVTLVEVLRQAGVLLSPRRARLLVRAIIAVHTAATVARRRMSICDAAELALFNALPQWADPTPPSAAQIVAAHLQAWEVTAVDDDPVRRAILEEGDPVTRVKLGADLGTDETTLGTLVTGALSAQPNDALRVGLAVVFSRFLAEHSLTPAAWGLVADRTSRVLQPGTRTTEETPGRRLEAWREASAWLADDAGATGPTARLERALISGCGPELLEGVDIASFIAEFRRRCAQFEVTE